MTLVFAEKFRPESDRNSGQNPESFRSHSGYIPESLRYESDDLPETPRLSRIPRPKLANALGFYALHKPERKGMGAVPHLSQRLGEEVGVSTFYEWRSLLCIQAVNGWYDAEDLLYLEVFGLYLQVDANRQEAFAACQELYHHLKEKENARQQAR